MILIFEMKNIIEKNEKGDYIDAEESIYTDFMYMQRLR